MRASESPAAPYCTCRQRERVAAETGRPSKAASIIAHADAGVHQSPCENSVADAQSSEKFKVTSDSWHGIPSVAIQLACAVAVQAVARVVTEEGLDSQRPSVTSSAGELCLEPM
jgi:hypothetical protein